MISSSSEDCRLNKFAVLQILFNTGGKPGNHLRSKQDCCQLKIGVKAAHIQIGTAHRPQQIIDNHHLGMHKPFLIAVKFHSGVLQIFQV
ncbi:hypothetical protein D3C75_1066070 [compost metagenome]